MNDSGVVGNTTVLNLLDHCREIAATNDIRHVAISMVTYGPEGKTDGKIAAGGEVELEKAQIESLKLLEDRVKKLVDNYTLEPPDPDLDASHVCYNCASGAVGFDFLVWLIDSEMARIRAKAPPPLRVGFFFGHDPAADQNAGRRDIWVDRVFRPALTLIGAVEDRAAVRGKCSGIYTTKNIASHSRDGEPVPRFKPPIEFAKRRDLSAESRDLLNPPITITLRESAHWSHRNSDLAAWFRFACDLKAEGERVVFIRDTEKAHETVAGFETDPQASLDLVHRAARYQAARANLFVANGPVTLAVFGDRPWLQFVPVEDEGSGYRANKPSFWRDKQGIEVGKQYPWSSPAQRMCWVPATYENIRLGWASIKDKLNVG